jgi:hypothetical protein
METSGKTDNLKRIVGMLLHKKVKEKVVDGAEGSALALTLDKTDTVSCSYCISYGQCQTYVLMLLTILHRRVISQSKSLNKSRVLELDSRKQP